MSDDSSFKVDQPTEVDDDDSSSNKLSDAQDDTGSDGVNERGEHSRSEGDHDAIVQLRLSNIQSLQSGTVRTVQRSGLLVCLDERVRKPFKNPCKGGLPNHSQEFYKRMQFRKRRFVPYGSNEEQQQQQYDEQQVVEEVIQSKEAAEGEVDPLVLWQSVDEGYQIKVDGMLVKFLRDHQREGVQFMFDCVTGQREYGQGCILADDMGLGKTLQGITLMWTLLKQGHVELGGVPIAKRVIIVCPTSLIGNWDNECSKWLNGQVKTIPLGESTREEVENAIRQFLQLTNMHQVMIVSYETFRMHSSKFYNREDACDLLICDEAHRLKNDQTQTTKALDGLSCRRRVLLSGTPMQNKLDEFYAMVNFCNPNVLGTPAQFRKHYENPILAAREPDASDHQVQLGQERTQQLQNIVDQFILRRTNTILSQHLPPKVIEVVCCKMTSLQTQLYQQFLHSKAARKLVEQSSGCNANTTQVLSAITQLRKICNHPRLIYDSVKAARTTSLSSRKNLGPVEDGFQGCEELLKIAASVQPGWENLSGKMSLLGRMLQILRKFTKDRIVIVSNFTQTLEMIASLCKERNYPFVQLDGSTSIKNRNKLVKQFCDAANDQFVFLLSSKAGGCGLNLIGANRLILFDPDWNPANDKQAAARVWRDGQKKQVYVYRFLAAGSIEEKVYQRQLSKEGLQNVVNQSGQMTSSKMSIEDLRDLFSLQDTISDTYDTLCCGKKTTTAEDNFNPVGSKSSKKHGFSVPKQRVCRAQIGSPNEDALHEWGHHTDVQNVPDQVMNLIGKTDVSFVFSCQIAGKQVEIQEAKLDEKLVEKELQNPAQNNQSKGFYLKNNVGQRRMLISAPVLINQQRDSFLIRQNCEINKENNNTNVAKVGSVSQVNNVVQQNTLDKISDITNQQNLNNGPSGKGQDQNLIKSNIQIGSQSRVTTIQNQQKNQQNVSNQSLTSMSLMMEQTTNNESIDGKKTVAIKVNSIEEDVVIDMTDAGNAENVENALIDLASKGTYTKNVSQNGGDTVIDVTNAGDFENKEGKDQKTGSAGNVGNEIPDVSNQNMYDAVKSRKIKQTGVKNSSQREKQRQDQLVSKQTGKQDRIIERSNQNNKENMSQSKQTGKQDRIIQKSNQNNKENLSQRKQTQQLYKAPENYNNPQLNTKITTCQNQSKQSMQQQNVIVLQRERASCVIQNSSPTKRPLQQICNNQLSSVSNKVAKLSKFDSPNCGEQSGDVNLSTPKSYANGQRLSRFKLQRGELSEKRKTNLSMQGP